MLAREQEAQDEIARRAQTDSEMEEPRAIAAEAVRADRVDLAHHVRRLHVYGKDRSEIINLQIEGYNRAVTEIADLIDPSSDAHIGGHPEMPLHQYEPAGDGTCLACLPPGAILASALAAANIACDSGEDVDRLIDELRKRGLTIAGAQRETK